MSKSDSILIKGSAGFIGFQFVQKLTKQHYKAIGVDKFSGCDSTLKRGGLNVINDQEHFTILQIDFADQIEIPKTFNDLYYHGKIASAGRRSMLDHEPTEVSEIRSYNYTWKKSEL